MSLLVGPCAETRASSCSRCGTRRGAVTSSSTARYDNRVAYTAARLVPGPLFEHLRRAGRARECSVATHLVKRANRAHTMFLLD
jgi:hypothetical protein